MQLVSVSVPLLYRPPPSPVAELPLTVQLVSVVVPSLDRPPPLPVVVAAGDRQSRDGRGDHSHRPGTPGSPRRR